MASSGKKKTTMAKLTRESKLRQRRLDKAARKDARKQTALEGHDGQPGDPLDPANGEQPLPEAGQPAPETVVETRADV